MVNRANYKAVKDFLTYQIEVIQLDEQSVKVQWYWLRHLLEWADETPLEAAHTIRPVFPKYLQSIPSGHGHGFLSNKGIERACLYARLCLEWLKRHGYKIDLIWVDTIRVGRLSAQPHKEHQAVTLDMVRALMAGPRNDLIAQRDKAAASFLFLSGMRATAFCTLPIGCVDMAERTIQQFPTLGVKTKNKKSAITRLLEIDDLLGVVTDWDTRVRRELPSTAPWYAVIENDFGADPRLTADMPGQRRGQKLAHNMGLLFDAANLPRMSPHKFRHGHARYGLQQAQTIGDMKAVSMNLMHSSLVITDSIYAVLADNEMQSRIARLGHNNPAQTTTDVAELVRLVMQQIGAKGA